MLVTVRNKDNPDMHDYRIFVVFFNFKNVILEERMLQRSFYTSIPRTRLVLQLSLSGHVRCSFRRTRYNSSGIRSLRHMPSVTSTCAVNRDNALLIYYEPGVCGNDYCCSHSCGIIQIPILLPFPVQNLVPIPIFPDISTPIPSHSHSHCQQ